MKIGLSAITFVPGGIGGMETYFRNLLDRYRELDKENEYTIFCDGRYAGEFPLDNEKFRIHRLDYAKPSLKWFVRGVLRNTVNMDILGREMRDTGMDLIHHPFTVLTPPGISTPSVLTFWDMQHEFFPEFFEPLDLRKRRRIYPASAHEATRIIVSAAFTRDCLVERYGISSEKIDVVHAGYGTEYRVIDDTESLTRAAQSYGLDRPFLFYPAATWPHKNHRNLLAALRILKERRIFDGCLVLSGIAMQHHGEVMEEIARQRLGDQVKVLGYLPYGDLPLLYNLARALVFPSLFEGFGLPVVEAMACGCPVVCSDATSLPEIAGDAGILFDPRSVEDMADAIAAVWTDEEQRIRMRERGLARARLFSWHNTASKTLEVYRRVGGT